MDTDTIGYRGMFAFGFVVGLVAGLIVGAL